MKVRKILFTIALAAVAAGAVVSCEMEPSTYYEQFYRVGTVKLNNLGKAYIAMDAIGKNEPESFDIRNFRTEADMKNFGVEDDDRVVAVMDLNATETMYNSRITLNRLQKIDISKLETSKPSDTLNYDYFFTTFTLVNVRYPEVWSTGHFVNIAPAYYVPEDSKPAEFYLDPVVFSHDTLYARLYSNIPSIDMVQHPSQSLLCFDMSSLRETSADPANQAVRTSVLNGLEGKQSFVLTVVTPDSLRTYNSNTGQVLWRRPMLDRMASVSVKFDF